MIYVYDDAIASDLASCINSEEANDMVKVMGTDGIMPLIAQMKEDSIKFPLICLIRGESTPIDLQRNNFTKLHKGIPTCIDTEKQTLYLEKSLPISLSYTLNILATNTADSDELLKEILFRYSTTYFVPVKLPYECDRTIRIGVTIEPNSIKKNSGTLEYLQSGTLYETTCILQCDGAVLLSYTPKHIERFAYDISQIEEHCR